MKLSSLRRNIIQIYINQPRKPQPRIKKMTPIAYQIFSRNNDTNGNPYRLALVYSDRGTVIKAYEFRQSSINSYLSTLYPNTPQLPTMHLQPSEYNETRTAFKEVLENH